MANTIKIPGELESVAVDHKIADASQIKDSNKNNKSQEQINTETYTYVENINEALAALSSEQTEALSVAEKANSNTVRIGYYICDTAASTAAKAFSAVGYILTAGGSMKVLMSNANTADNATLNINSTGAKPLYYTGERASAINTWEAGEIVEVYYDGTNYYANNVTGGSGSGDGAFDVSAKYPTSGLEGGNTYTLEGALAVLNTNLPASKKKGGMSIRFVSSSDNKYVQCRYMGTAIDGDPNPFLDTTNWQMTTLDSSDIDSPIATSKVKIPTVGSLQPYLFADNYNKIENWAFLVRENNYNYSIPKGKYKIKIIADTACNTKAQSWQYWFGLRLNTTYIKNLTPSERLESEDINIEVTEDNTTLNIWAYPATAFSVALLQKELVEKTDVLNKSITIKENTLNAQSKYTGIKITLIGDSISTYAGYIPDGFVTYYPRGVINSVDKTYWYKVTESLKGTIQNLSYSGSTVTNTNHSLYSRAILADRDSQLIIIALGVNDRSKDDNVGSLDYNKAIEDYDESIFTEAYLKGLRTLMERNPLANFLLVSIARPDEVPNITNAIKTIAEHYNLMFFDARNWYDGELHPDADPWDDGAEMVAIANGMLSSLGSQFEQGTSVKNIELTEKTDTIYNGEVDLRNFITLAKGSDGANFEKTYSGIIEQGKTYIVRIIGNNVADVSPSTAKSYAQITFVHDNIQDILIAYKKNEGFTNKALTFTANYDGDLVAYSRISGNLYFEICETDLLTGLNNKIDAVKSKLDNSVDEIKTIHTYKFPTGVNSNVTEDTVYPAGDYTFSLVGSGTVHSTAATWGSWFSIDIIDVNYNVIVYNLIVLSPSDLFTEQSINYTAKIPFKVNYYAYYNGNISVNIISHVNNLQQRLTTLENKVFGDLVLKDFVFPENDNDGHNDTTIFPAGSYKFHLKGYGVVHPDAALWSGWLNFGVKDENGQNYERLYLIAKDQLFEEVTIPFESETSFKVSYWAYYIGHIELELLQYGSKIEELQKEVDDIKHGASEFRLSHSDIVTDRTSLCDEWDNGYGIDAENLEVIEDANSNITHDFIPVTGGIYSVENNGSRISDMEILYFDSNYQGVHVDADETTVGLNGTTYITHKRINGYVILKQSLVEQYDIAYMKIAVPNTYTTSNLKIYKFSRATVTEEYVDGFNDKSGNGKIIRMSWFKRGENYSDSLVLADMYALAAMGATLFLDDGDVLLDRVFDTAADGLGKGISIIADEGTQIRPSSSFNSSYLLDYKQSEQCVNVSVFNENGELFAVKPIIKGGTYECDGRCGGIHGILSRGLLVEDILVHNAPTYGLKLDTSPRSGFEYLVNKCRFEYDLYVAANNTALGGSMNDSSVNGIVIIGYKNGVILNGDSLVINDVHGWIGWNYAYQWEDSIFMQVRCRVMNCYADTYKYGFIMTAGVLISCIKFANSAFASAAPINDIATSVKQFGNGW